MRVAPEVAEALAAGDPVVALESTIIAHGLPAPGNVRTAAEIEDVVRDHGAVPATIAILEGRIRIGLDRDGLARLGHGGDAVAKCGVRDLPVVLADRGDGATTVAATAQIAHRAGIRTFATGGIGGVHRGARDTWDESADLVALARLPITVVSAGVKSILDVGATLERLESLNVTVAGYGTDRFPGFYLADSGHPVPWRVDSPAAAARIARRRDALGLPGAILLANPLPADRQMDPGLHDRLLAEGLAAAAAEGVVGKAATPFLLERFHRLSEGESLRANVQLVKANAALAAQVAAGLAA